MSLFLLVENFEAAAEETENVSSFQLLFFLDTYVWEGEKYWLSAAVYLSQAEFYRSPLLCLLSQLTRWSCSLFPLPSHPSQYPFTEPLHHRAFVPHFAYSKLIDLFIITLSRLKNAA